MEGKLTRQAILWMGAFVAAAIVPVAAFFLYFLAHMPTGEAVRAVGGSWTTLLTSDVSSNWFFVSGMGFENPVQNLLIMLAVSACIVALLLLACVIDVRCRDPQTTRRRAGMIVNVVIICAILMDPGILLHFGVGRALPVLTPLAFIALAALFWRGRHDRSAAARALLLTMWTTLGGMLLGKMLLNGRLHHYGFYLAMPAMLMLVAGLIWGVTAFLRERYGRGQVYQWLALLMVAGCVIYYVRCSNTWYRRKTLTVGQGGDAMTTFPPDLTGLHLNGGVVAKALDWIDEHMAPDATFVAFPEGVMLNYLARRANPTRYINFMMTEVLAFGEDNMLAAFQAEAPDYIILAHKDTSEFGVGLFGQDERYGQRIMEWVNRRYETAELFGDEPLRDPKEFGIKILERR